MMTEKNASTTRVVINSCFGGFGLSPRGVEAYLARKGKQVWWFTDARDENGKLKFGKPKVPNADPTGILMAYSYTSPDATDESYFTYQDIARDDPDLVAVVEELGTESFGEYAALNVVEIPADVDWEIAEYDGNEHIAEKHRTWR